MNQSSPNLLSVLLIDGEIDLSCLSDMIVLNTGSFSRFSAREALGYESILKASRDECVTYTQLFVEFNLTD